MNPNSGNIMEETTTAHDTSSNPAFGDGLPAEAVKDDEIIAPFPPASKDPPIRTDASLSTAFQSLTDKALYFLSHASNETLGACLVGLGASTYLVLGRVGLVIIGVAGGVVLQATWEGIRSDTRDEATKRAEQERRREAGVEVAKRMLQLQSDRGITDEKPEDTKVYANQQLDFSSFGSETEAALNTFTDAIISDYVKYWYAPTLPGEESFPESCRRTLVAFLLSLTGHLRRKRPADAFLDFVTNASSIIIVFLNELAAALNASPNCSAEDAIAAYLELKPDSSLSYILNQKSQSNRLGDAAEDILQAYLDPKAYNCAPVHNFLRQVLAQLVLGYTLNLCSEPSWINEWIVYGLEESETTKEVMDIVDAGVEGRVTESVSAKTAASPDQTNKKSKIGESFGDPRAAPQPNVSNHKRHVSKAEEAMDEAMKEAKRLTQLMIEEDERRAREEAGKQSMMSSTEDISDNATPGAPTPTSSQSDRDRQEDSTSLSSQRSSSVVETSTTMPENVPPVMTPPHQFTSFDQLVAEPKVTALAGEHTPVAPDSSPLTRQTSIQLERPTLTLYNATVSVFDDSVPGERASIKAKPTTDFMIQIEPAIGSFSGWMIARKYADFEMLHEVLRRISVITGVPQFTSAHADLPKWKTNTKASLRNELERYLTDAVRYQPLAESEGMKRFLEKEQGLSKSPSGKGFGWPTPDAFGKFGGDMMNVLTKAPKQVAGGGKAVFGGVAGLVGGVAGVANISKRSSSQTNLSPVVDSGSGDCSPMHRSRQSITDRALSTFSGLSPRPSQEITRGSLPPVDERRTSVTTSGSTELKPGPTSGVSSQRVSSEVPRAVEQVATPETPQPPLPERPMSPEEAFEQPLNLPPPPSEISDDFGSPGQSSRKSVETYSSSMAEQLAMAGDEHYVPPTPPMPSKPQPAGNKPPLTERETSVALELMFAVVTELYTLSSAWNIRRTFLTAAKTFLLRPGNPQLTTIRDLLQTSLLDSNLNDSGVAAHIYKLRENALPTAEEMEIWKRDYPEKTAEQKEELRVKARKLLVTKGTPQALTSVMGAAASGEALGKVFDCLQQPNVSRGLIFGLMLQALKMVTH
ncbi:Hypothetical protein R9X50_00299200 [Acrodontium crateriforme]|uniref:PXA domain-containing protein n=1 Tax=Acrodontium crateriforme TaxID=150365 RepID=A0AAQ3M215_9PEZI|nr:Hypothetical protein R9X50_00299200 [Acrodontium crateriforme]